MEINLQDGAPSKSNPFPKVFRKENTPSRIFGQQKVTLYVTHPNTRHGHTLYDLSSYLEPRDR